MLECILIKLYFMANERNKGGQNYEFTKTV